MDVRVLDYIDDKLAASSDFEALDSLLENVKNQQDLLKRQLDNTRRDHDGSRNRADHHTASLRQKAEAFQQEQADIDRRLLMVTQSETSDDAAQKFEAGMERLRKLEVATGFMELLQEVDRLNADCTSQLGVSDEAALAPYRRLQQLATALQPLQQAAEGAAPHLLDHISRQVYILRATIQKSFAEDLEMTLKKMGWPKATNAVPLALQDEWEKNVGRLLELQRPELDVRELDTGTRGASDEPPVLLPFEVLARPLEQRFTYHFSGNKPTNRLDKPEYFLSHTSDLIAGYGDFIYNALQPILLKQFRGSDLALTPAYVDARCAFITALLPMLRRKLTSFASQVSNQPNLLSHLVQEILAFDTNLTESHAYAPISPSTPWRGLAHFLLDTRGYYAPWLNAERDFALARYNAIIDTPSAGELDYDSVPSSVTKPTKAAIRVNDLLETITDRYRLLSSFSQKLRFLMDIQIAVFDLFHTRLHGSLEAYLTMTSSLARTMHGVTREDQTELQGVKGLDRLCRVFGSAAYLEQALRDWSDDVFFLELWEELQDRANNRDEISRNLGTLREIQSKTSAAVGQDGVGGEGVQGALFDETADAYRRLRVRSEGLVVETLVYNTNIALRPYTRVGTWASVSASGADGSLSAELDPTLRLLGEYFVFLSKAMGRVPLRRVARQICGAVQNTLWEGLVCRYSFSTAGAGQLALDVQALCGVVDRFVGAGQAERGMRRLVEGVRLLSLPIKGEVRRELPSRSGDAADEDDDVGAWGDGDDEGDGQAGGEDGEGREMGLFEVERLVFMDNESARHALETLGMEGLSEGDAREVLGRRIELGS